MPASLCHPSCLGLNNHFWADLSKSKIQIPLNPDNVFSFFPLQTVFSGVFILCILRELSRLDLYRTDLLLKKVVARSYSIRNLWLALNISFYTLDDTSSPPPPSPSSMAYTSTYNSSASGSQSPLSEVSDNTSPNMPSGGRITPGRNRIDAPRSTASKGGCWYVLLSILHVFHWLNTLSGPVAYAEKWELIGATVHLVLFIVSTTEMRRTTRSRNRLLCNVQEAQNRLSRVGIQTSRLDESKYSISQPSAATLLTMDYPRIKRRWRITRLV